MRALLPPCAIVLAALVGCTPSSSTSTSPASDAAAATSNDAPPVAVSSRYAAPPPSWSRVSFESEDAKSHTLISSIEAFPDRRVVFAGGKRAIPSQTEAPVSLMNSIEAWVKTPLPPSEALDAAAPSEFALRVRVVTDTAHEAVYTSSRLPAGVSAMYRAFGKLTTAPREAIPCSKWDGKSDFTLTLQGQEFGAVPGPFSRVTIKSDGTASRATASGAGNAELAVVKTTTVSAAELDAIRGALLSVDLGHFHDAFAGGGEGSNFRSVELTAPGGACARGFANQYPAAMKPLLDAVTPVSKRLAADTK